MFYSEIFFYFDCYIFFLIQNFFTLFVACAKLVLQTCAIKKRSNVLILYL
jgi:hypothetical protein